MNTLNVTVMQRPPVRVAYLRYTGSYGAGVSDFWRTRFYPYLVRHQLTGRPIYGVSHDDPNITAAQQCRYDTCVEVPEGFVVGGDALETEIAGGTYAFLPFFGTSASIGDAWNSLMRHWLPDSGWQIDGRPTFEYYPPGAAFDEATGRFECQIVIPLAPL